MQQRDAENALHQGQRKKKNGVTETKSKKVFLHFYFNIKISKESRVIPNLIYAVEQLDRYIIQLSKKTKMNLMSYVKVYSLFVMIAAIHCQGFSNSIGQYCG